MDLKGVADASTTRWKINDFVFCEKQQTLSRGEQTSDLEPRLAEVLSYFCRHPESTISRDEFIEQVWDGQIVTENAINRVIAKLRKELDDTAKSSKFIVTYPKKGYRFICPVSEYSNESKHSVFSLNLGYLLFISMVIIVGAISTIIYTAAEYPISIAGSKPITWGDAEEYDPAISPDGKYLTYSAHSGNQLILYLQDLQTSDTTQISDNSGDAGGGQWSADGKKLLYLYTNSEQCEYRIISFDNGQFGDELTAHNCPQGSYGKAIFSHDGNVIYYAERSASTHPYYIYSLDLKTNQRTKVKQPDAYLAGNREFDLHPNDNKLLITSPDEHQVLGFYVLDLDSNQLLFQFKKDGYICCAIWSQTGSRIVMMGDYPAKSLVSFDMNGKNQTVELSTNLRIGPPSRIPNSKDYLFYGGTYDFDIELHSFENKTQFTFANSSKGDYLPVANNTNTTLAFMSERSGEAQVWLQKLDSNIATKLTHFSDHQRYYDLTWSPSGDKIALLLINSIKVIDVENGKTSTLKLPLQEIRSLSWSDNANLSFSTLHEDKWRVNFYNIESNKITLGNMQWAYVSHDPNNGDRLTLDQQGNLHFNDLPIALNTSHSYIRKERKLEFRLHNKRIYFQQLDDKSMVMFDTVSTVEKSLFSMDKDVDFSVSNKGIWLATLKHRTSEIYRTYQ